MIETTYDVPGLAVGGGPIKKRLRNKSRKEFLASIKLLQQRIHAEYDFVSVKFLIRRPIHSSKHPVTTNVCNNFCTLIGLSSSESDMHIPNENLREFSVPTSGNNRKKSIYEPSEFLTTSFHYVINSF